MRMSTADIAELYEAEHGRLRRFVRRFVGNHVTAEDIVHQGFVNVLSRLNSGAGVSVSPAYLSRSVRNLALNHLRDMARRGAVVLDGENLEELSDAGPTPEMVAIYRQELRRLLDAIAKLPDRRRECFVLSRIEGLTYEEVGRRMSISRNTVITQVVAALAQLDAALT